MRRAIALPRQQQTETHQRAVTLMRVDAAAHPLQPRRRLRVPTRVSHTQPLIANGGRVGEVYQGGTHRALLFGGGSVVERHLRRAWLQRGCGALNGAASIAVRRRDDRVLAELDHECWKPCGGTR